MIYFDEQSRLRRSSDFWVPDGEYAGAAYRRKRGKNEDIMDDGE